MKRSRTGCLVCKQRKVKCDENFDGGCLNCRRLNLECSVNYNANEKPKYTPKRLIGACDACRTVKLRCSRERPICQRCRERDIQCSYPLFPRRSRYQQTSESVLAKLPPSLHENNGELPTDITTLKHFVRAFFQHVAPVRCLCIIHKPSLLRALDRGTHHEDFSTSLLLAICALGIRHSIPAKDSETVASSWIRRAQSMALEAIGLPTFMNLATLVLLTEYHLSFGLKSHAFMLTASCVRMATLLRLQDLKEIEVSTGQLEPKMKIKRECERRLLWATYIHDVVVSIGTEALELERTPPRIPLPVENRYFMAGSEDEYTIQSTNQLDVSSHNLGLEAMIVHLFQCRQTILRLIRQSTEHTIQPWDSDSEMMKTLNALETFENAIPSRFLLTEENIYIHQEFDDLGPLYNMHLLLHQCYCDLLRVSLPGYVFPIAKSLDQAPQESIHTWQTSCRNHAEIVSEILEQCQGVIGLDYLLLPAFAYESSKILALFYVICLREKTSSQKSITFHRIDSNLDSWKKIRNPISTTGTSIPEAFYQFLRNFGFGSLADKWNSSSSENLIADMDLETSTISHPLSTFNLAQKEIALTTRGQPQEDHLIMTDDVGPSTTNLEAVEIEEQTNTPFDETVYSVEESFDFSTLLTSDLEEFLMFDPDMSGLFNDPAPIS